MGPTRPETTQRGPETTQRGSDRPESTSVGPGRPEFDPAVPGPSRRRSVDSPQRSSDHSSRQGVITPPPPPPARGVGSGNSSDEDPSSQNRQQRDDQQDEDNNFRPASLDLLLNYIVPGSLPTLGPTFLQVAPRHGECRSRGRVVPAVLQSSLVWAYEEHL